MAQRTSIALTGDDLTVADVWAVAVEGAQATLSESARGKMRAARELVERAAHGSREHTYGVNTGFGRFVNRAIPDEDLAATDMVRKTPPPTGVRPWPSVVKPP